MKNKSLKILIVVLLISASCFAQHPVYTSLTEKDGLPDIEFYSVLEDKQGFIWLAADKGLYRYDGKHFKNYSHPDKRGLSVFGLKLDNEGHVWCNNISGQFFYVENDSLLLFKDIKYYDKGQLTGFDFLDKSINIYGYENSFKIDLKDKNKKIDTLQHYSYLEFGTKTNQGLYFVTKNGRNTKPFKSKISSKDSVPLANFRPTSTTVGVIHETKLWYYIYDHLQRKINLFHEQNKHLKKVNLPNELIGKKIIQMHSIDTKLWICTDKGVYVYYATDGKLKWEQTFFKDQIITSMLKDQNNNYWFTSLQKGVYIIPNIHIKQYKLPQYITNISALEKVDEDTFLFGSTDGRLARFSVANQITEDIPLIDKTSVFSICNNVNDEVYISQNYHSFRYNIKTKAITYDNNFIGAKDLSVIDENRLLGAFTALSKIVEVNEKHNIKTQNVRERRAYTVHYSKKSKALYAGYVDGFYQYNEQLEPKIIKYKNNSIFALDIDETVDNTVWVSTFKEGIIGIKNGEVIINYSTKNGLLSNQTSTIKADGKDLWIVTDKGIQVLDTNTKLLKAITKKEGLTSFNISDIAIFNETVFLGSNIGLFEINKNEAFKTIKLPEIYFTSVSIDEELTALKSSYNLPSNTNKIKFRFHANGYLAGENMTYYYKLKGANAQWSSVSKGVNEVVFNSLSAGDYTFQLKAVETDGVRETNMQSIAITINLPFYREWWFIISVFCCLLLVLWQYFSRRVRSLKLKQNETLEKERISQRLISSQLESLRSQMNPHFIFNALNSIQEYIVLNEKHLASAFLVKFSRLIRMYLEHSQEHYIPLKEEVNALELYLQLEKDRFEDALDYTLEVSSELNQEQIKVPSIFIQPYVENAIKHGLLHKINNRQLLVSFHLNASKDSLICIIKDNGIGRVASKKMKQNSLQYHKSYATKANQKRIDLINVDRDKKVVLNIIDLYDEFNNAIGTKVELNIPL
jgi:ligand-binding sensor domain-containing protein/two-component sensor histidine kinase